MDNNNNTITVKVVEEMAHAGGETKLNLKLKLRELEYKIKKLMDWVDFGSHEDFEKSSVIRVFVNCIDGIAEAAIKLRAEVEEEDKRRKRYQNLYDALKECDLIEED